MIGLAISLLFSSRAELQLCDSDNLIFGWDVLAVLASGRLHGLPAADLYGCLFFHIKDQFIKFATCIRNFNINITMTVFDARDLAKIILKGGLTPFSSSCFDRIETCNVADYITILRVLEDWGPLLNRQDPHATLLIYSMNWQGHCEPDLKSLLLDKASVTKYASIMVCLLVLVSSNL